ncbi:unnamed protein product [Alopecurus aequalis]
MAAALRSSAVLAPRRAAASPRLSAAAGAASANTTVRAMHYDYSGRRCDASGGLGPAKPEDKYDGYFAFAATIIAAGIFELMEGEYFGLGKMNTRPRMSRRRS